MNKKTFWFYLKSIGDSFPNYDYLNYLQNSFKSSYLPYGKNYQKGTFREKITEYK